MCYLKGKHGPLLLLVERAAAVLLTPVVGRPL
jgi:hypothetical protein